MSTFIVVTFPDEASALQGIQTLKDLNADRSLVLYGAGLVSKGEKGRLSMRVVSEEELGVVAAGALIGGLAGLGVGLLAAAVMAAGGAVFGASAALTDRGTGKAILGEVSRHLRRETVALVADVNVDDRAVFESRMKALGGTVHNRKQPLD
ncbi:hypothetical protein SAZ10_24320 [Mesorhizobium sp. BAC0120]|uniref:hypothetical protein n=1 Tax=Mesorhizobium sp. BAC0120 TaxID=3090670 RepID=UPI00298D426F|nr:hypothetical protein [Mesorhizobium sp. BAC0120]MDW6024885.1 hypothetical protein [Mesorhizobium sp. BAC0120]